MCSFVTCATLHLCVYCICDVCVYDQHVHITYMLFCVYLCDRTLSRTLSRRGPDMHMEIDAPAHCHDACYY